jgi:nucleolar protein 9
LAFRRKLVNHFLSPTSADSTGDDSILRLALSKPGSHVLDALWTSTSHPSLLHIKERICTTLHAHQAALKDDFVGRVVLRNWTVELFGRHRAAWVAKARESESAERPSKTGDNKNATKGQRGRVAESGVGLNVTSAKGQRVGAGGARGSGVLKGNKTAIELARERFAAGKARQKVKHAGRAPGAKK